MGKKLAVAIAAVLSVLGLALASPGSALAGVSSFTYYTNAASEQASGYFASNLGSVFTHASARIGSNASLSFESLSQGPTNGVGIGLCNQSSGAALQVGDVYNGGGTMSVDFGVGDGSQYKSVDKAHKCFSGIVNSGGATPVDPALSNISVSDTVDVQVLYDNRHGFHAAGLTCSRTQAMFMARDVTADPGTWYNSGCVDVGETIQQYNEADAGVVADGQLMSAPAVNFLAAFAHVGLTNAAGHHGSFQSDGSWTAYRVVGTSNGLATGSQLLAPQVFRNDGFSILAGTSVG